MVLPVLSLLALVAGTALLLRLHAVRTGLLPVRDAVSDYGTTRYHALYRAMVISLGLAAAFLALALSRETDASPLVWLWIFAAARVAIAGFMTDRDPPPFTTEGRIHWLLAAAAFTSIALAASDISWSGDPAVLRSLGFAVAASAVATLVSRVVPPLRPVFGLVERLLYVTSIAWLAVSAISLL